MGYARKSLGKPSVSGLQDCKISFRRRIGISLHGSGQRGCASVEVPRNFTESCDLFFDCSGGDQRTGLS